MEDELKLEAKVGRLESTEVLQEDESRNWMEVAYWGLKVLDHLSRDREKDLMEVAGEDHSASSHCVCSEKASRRPSHRNLLPCRQYRERPEGEL